MRDTFCWKIKNFLDQTWLWVPLRIASKTDQKLKMNCLFNSVY